MTDEFGAELYLEQIYMTKSKNAQKAHEAIRPSDFSKKIAGNTDDQKKVYELIWSRTVASQMVDAKLLRTKIIANITNGEIPNFSINGTRILNQGWLMADPAARNDEVDLPIAKASDPLVLEKMNSQEKETQPPPRYSEAGLVKELEKEE